MGRPPKRIRAKDIDEAKVRFHQSVEAGNCDWRYVALAIGDRPHDPPSWAVDACVELRDRERRAASRSNTLLTDQQIGVILDRVVAHYLVREYQFEQETGEKVGREQGATRYAPDPLSQAIRNACDHLNHLVNATDDDLRIIRNAWNDEQQRDAALSSTIILEGWETTRRIQRVVLQLEAPLYGLSSDPSRAIWEAKRSDD